MIADTYGDGKAGNLTVNAQNVQVIGRSADGQFGSLLGTSSDENSTGDAGDLTINTHTLLVKDGALISAGTFGTGKSGSLKVSAVDVQIIGESADGQFASGLSAQALSNSQGDAGELTIKTDTLLVRDGAQVSASTFGESKGSNLTIDAQHIQLIGESADGQFPSGLFTSAETNSKEDAGDLTINTETLLVQDGAQVGTATYSVGKGGNLTVDAQNIQLIGTNADGQFPSSLGTAAQQNSTGDAGDVTIKTHNLLLLNGAQVNTGTFSAGKGGNLTVDAQNIQLIGKNANGQVLSGLFASANRNSTGDAGDLFIQTDNLLIQDAAGITVQSLGAGSAGNMILNARSIRLNDNAFLSANTRSAKVDPNREQATININSQDLIMSRNSNIRTNARGENVIGGNINIDTDFLIAFGNSDISANSTNFRGGRVRIDAQGIFGTQFRSAPSDRTSDITATGARTELSGTVEIHTPEVDPNSGLVELPTVPVDTEVAQGCTAGSSIAKSQFTITGRGGLPPNPGDALNTDAVQVDLVTLNPKVAQRSNQAISTTGISSTPAIVKASGWVIDANDKVTLIASTTTPDSSWQRMPDCHAFNQHSGG